MQISFVSKRIYFFSLSIVLVLTSIVSLFTFGLKPGIDFTGGSLIELSFTEVLPEVADVRELFVDGTYGSVLVQPVGDMGYLLKMRFITEDEHQEILQLIRGAFEIVVDEEAGITANRVLEERVETIGPVISSTLKARSIEAGIAVSIAIILFIAYAFRKVSRPVASWKYGITAIIALTHDVLITLGIFALLGHLYGVEIGIPFVVALLTILGYSVNDTIVVFDRVRENLIKYGSNNFSDLVNRGLNQTFVRSINTSLTTILVLGSLFVFGGESIKYFALALMIGVASGTYSSIFLASPLLVAWQELSSRGKKK